MSGYALGTTEVADTFAEAFPMRYARLVITAATDAWALEAARSATGFATSVIGHFHHDLLAQQTEPRLPNCLQCGVLPPEEIEAMYKDSVGM